MKDQIESKNVVIVMITRDFERQPRHFQDYHAISKGDFFCAETASNAVQYFVTLEPANIQVWATGDHCHPSESGNKKMCLGRLVINACLDLLNSLDNVDCGSVSDTKVVPGDNLYSRCMNVCKMAKEGGLDFLFILDTCDDYYDMWQSEAKRNGVGIFVCPLITCDHKVKLKDRVLTSITAFIAGLSGITLSMLAKMAEWRNRHSRKKVISTQG